MNITENGIELNIEDIFENIVALLEIDIEKNNNDFSSIDPSFIEFLVDMNIPVNKNEINKIYEENKPTIEFYLKNGIISDNNELKLKRYVNRKITGWLREKRENNCFS